MRTWSLTLAAALVLAATPAHAGALRLDPWRGHVAIGYAKVFSDSLAPGGSLSVAGGVDYPVGQGLRLGPTVSFALLGSTNVTQGSIVAALDYSLVDAALQLHWTPPKGPVSRVSIGPGIAGPRAALSVAGGGAGFERFAVHGADAEVALDLTAMPRREGLLRAGFEAGTRVVFVPSGAWTLLTLRLAVHY